MATIEDLIYSAFEHGRRDQLFKEVSNIKANMNGRSRKLEDIYQEAYENVMKA